MWSICEWQIKLKLCPHCPRHTLSLAEWITLKLAKSMCELRFTRIVSFKVVSGITNHKITFCIHVRLFQRQSWVYSYVIFRCEWRPWWSVLSVCLLKGCNLNNLVISCNLISFSLCVEGVIQLNFKIYYHHHHVCIFFFFLNILICQSTRPVLVCLTVTAYLLQQEVMSSIKSFEA